MIKKYTDSYSLSKNWLQLLSAKKSANILILSPNRPFSYSVNDTLTHLVEFSNLSNNDLSSISIQPIFPLEECENITRSRLSC